MKKVLLVEDNQKYRDLLQSALVEEKIDVIIAKDGQEAIEKVEKDGIDLILLDIVMPEMDGIDFYYQLKNKLKKHISIIVLTNLTDTTAYDGDIKEVLIKSNVSLDEVIAKVKANL